eukprot:1581342-Rhodomonas_salina.4
MRSQYSLYQESGRFHLVWWRVLSGGLCEQPLCALPGAHHPAPRKPRDKTDHAGEEERGGAREERREGQDRGEARRESK